MTKIEILRALCAYADQHDVMIALARPLVSLAGRGDLDILIFEKDTAFFLDALRSAEALGVTAVYPRTDGISVHLYGVNDQDGNALKIDFITSCSLFGIAYRSVSEVLHRRQSKDGIYLLDDIDQAFLLFMTHSVKHKVALKESYYTFVAQARRAAKDSFAIAVADNFGFDRVAEIEEALDDNKVITNLRWSFLSYHVNAQALDRMADLGVYAIDRLLRMWGRHYHVAFYGVDGAGKTTLLEGLKKELANTVTAIRHPHAIPSWPWRKEAESDQVLSNPHAHPCRGAVGSFFKLIYMAFRYRVAALWPSYGVTLYLHDRHYYDLLADPLRYRYGGSQWMVRIIGWFIPKVMASVVIDVKPETAYARKREVSLTELKRQSAEYRGLAPTLQNPCLLNGDLPIQTMHNIAFRHILSAMEKQAEKSKAV